MEIEGAEVRKLEGYLDWRKGPVDKSIQGGLFAAVFVLVAEVFENLAFLANASNLVTYFHQYMHFPLAKSANTVTNFMGTSFLLPLLGGYLSDAFMPTFVTVIAFAGIEFVGMVLLTIQAHYPSLKPEACDMQELQAGVCEQAHGSKAGMLYMGLYLVALGVGGLKGSLPVHGAEQFDENETKERRLRSNFFNWFLFSMCVGSLLAVTFVVWVQDNKGWQWGFGISTVSVLLILFAFVGGTTVYRNKIPQRSPLTRIAQVFVAAMYKRRIAKSQLHGNDMDDVRERRRSAMETADPLLQTSQFRFLDKASIPDPSCPSATGEESPWRLCSVTQVEEVKINGLESDVFVGAALIDMYAKCRKIVDARQVFNKISARDMVLWTAMISGYAQNGHDYEALTTFQQMQRAGLATDSITIISVLLACTHLGTLQRGKCVHGYIIRIGFESDVNVANALIDMYAKCGSIYFAHKLFDIMPERDVISWSAMIAGYGMHGQCETALAFFRQMQRAGIKPNYVTFISVLSACSHAGLVNKGWEYFDSMHRVYCIGPSLRHYACMVDLLGRCGRLDEAKDFIEKMPLEPDAGVWGALLGGCRIHCNIELGEHAAEHLFSLEPQNAGYYVLLSNIYATCCRWDDVAKVRMLMRERKLKKMPGCSSIEVYSKVHSFVAEEKSHPQSGEIYAMLEILAKRLKEAGYVPDTKFVLEGLE